MSDFIALSSAFHNHLSPGTVIADQFEIIDILGEGLISIIYLARYVKDKNDVPGSVVLKVLREPAYVDRLMNEARLMAQLREVEQKQGDGLQAVPDFIAASKEPPAPYLAMEYIKGIPILEMLVDSPQGIGEPLVIDIAQQLLRLLHLLHTELKRTYIDFKLESLWWEEDRGQLRVMSWDVLDELTEEGVERDIFWASLYTYKMATGGLPELRGNLCVGPLDQLPGWHRLTAGMQQFLTQALHFSSEQRFPSAQAARVALQELQGYWQQDVDALIHAGQDELTRAENARKAEHISERYRRARAIVQIVRHIYHGPHNQQLDDLETKLKTELYPVIALYKGGSHEKALSLLQQMISKAVEPAPLRWFAALLENVQCLDSDLRDLAIEAGEIYTQAISRLSELRYAERIETYQRTDKLLQTLADQTGGEGAGKFALLHEALRTQLNYTLAQFEHQQGNLIKTIELYQKAENSCKADIEEYLPQAYLSQVRAALEQAQKQYLYRASPQSVLSDLQNHIAKNNLAQAEDLLYRSFLVYPGNPVLLDGVLEIMGEYKTDKPEVVLSLAERIPALVGNEARLTKLRHAARERLDTARREHLKTLIEESYLDQYKVQHIIQFQAIQDHLRDGQWERASRAAHMLLDMFEALPNSLQDVIEETWRDKGDELLIAAWESPLPEEHQQNFIDLALRFYPQPEQLIEFQKRVEAELRSRQKNRQALLEEFRRFQWSRVLDLDMKNQREIAEARRDITLTLERFRKLVNEVLYLLPVGKDTLEASAIRERYSAYRKELKAAEILWEEAQKTSDERKQTIINELLESGFFGWHEVGDFQDALGLKREQVTKYQTLPFDVGEAPTLEDDKVVRTSIDRKLREISLQDKKIGFGDLLRLKQNHPTYEKVDVAILKMLDVYSPDEKQIEKLREYYPPTEEQCILVERLSDISLIKPGELSYSCNDPEINAAVEVNHWVRATVYRLESDVHSLMSKGAIGGVDALDMNENKSLEEYPKVIERIHHQYQLPHPVEAYIEAYRRYRSDDYG